jgi:2-phosphoglycerate kinase
VHRSHFAARASEHTGRPAERYLDRFDDIRRVQRYIKSQALSHGVPVIANYSFDRALAAIIDLVMERATERTASPGSRRAPRAVAPPLRRRTKEAEREAVPGHGQHRGDPRDQPLGRPRRRDHQPLVGGQGGRRPRTGLEGDPDGGRGPDLPRDDRARARGDVPAGSGSGADGAERRREGPDDARGLASASA